jgi:flagellar biosynthesis component FlhA
VLDVLTHNSDVAMALAVVMIIALMVIPLPPALLSLLIVINMALAITILLISMYTTRHSVVQRVPVAAAAHHALPPRHQHRVDAADPPEG